MQELTDKVIILKSTDNKEKNKNLTLLGFNGGLFNAYARGVKEPKAKLKFLGLPFSLCDIEYIKNGNLNTIKTAKLLENFTNIYKNLSKLENASLCVETILVVGERGESESELFKELLISLTKINLDNFETQVALNFVLKALKIAGYEMSFDRCSKCEETECEHYFLNFNTGELLCQNCVEKNCTQIKASTVFALKKIKSNNFEMIDDEILTACKKLLNNFFLVIYEKQLKTLQ